MKLLINRLFIIISLSSTLISCEAMLSKSNQPGISNFVHTTVDIAAKINVSPSDNEIVNYSETDQFDLDLLASMKGEISPITVEMSGSNLTRTQLNNKQGLFNSTPRIERWLWKITHSDGQVIACKEGSRTLLAVVIPIVIGLIADAIQDYITYRPAQYYNAKIFYWPDNDVINRILFYRRTQEPFTCD